MGENTKPKRGRPETADPRKEVHQMRLSASEKRELQRKADDAGVSLSAYLRARGLSE